MAFSFLSVLFPIILPFLLLPSPTILVSARATFDQAQSFGGQAFDSAMGIAVDPTDPTVSYIAGLSNSATITFPPPSTAGTFTNVLTDAYVLKLSHPGNVVVWAKQFTRGTSTSQSTWSNERAWAVAVSPTGTAVYAVGAFGPHSLTLGGVAFTPSRFDGFVVKLDAANGDVLWARSAGGDWDDSIKAVAVNPSNGDVYVAGDFPSTTMAFDTVTGKITGRTLTNFGAWKSHDSFVAKLDQATGDVLWINQLGGNGNNDRVGVLPVSAMTAMGRPLAVTAGGDVFMVGSSDSNTNIMLQNSATDSYSIRTSTPWTANDGYLVKMNGATGQATWSLTFGTAGADPQPNYATAFGVDDDDQGLGTYGYLAGYYTSQDLRIGNLDKAVADPRPGGEPFVAKIALVDGSVIWVRALGSTSPDDRALDVAADRIGGVVHVVGRFGSTNGGNGEVPGALAGLVDSQDYLGAGDGYFLSLAMSDGTSVDGMLFSSGNLDIAQSLVVASQTRAIYICGEFSGPYMSISSQGTQLTNAQPPTEATLRPDMFVVDLNAASPVTPAPTLSPTTTPPSLSPSSSPTQPPTLIMTQAPSASPSSLPPTSMPSTSPSASPSSSPSAPPSSPPSLSPVVTTTANPTFQTYSPTLSPTMESSNITTFTDKTKRDQQQQAAARLRLRQVSVGVSVSLIVVAVLGMVVVFVYRRRRDGAGAGVVTPA